MINFGDPTSATAITWMAAQIARWNLGIDFDDRTIIDAAASVLPREADAALTPVEINGRLFNPNTPTEGYTRSNA